MQLQCQDHCGIRRNCKDRQTYRPIGRQAKKETHSRKHSQSGRQAHRQQTDRLGRLRDSEVHTLALERALACSTVAASPMAKILPLLPFTHRYSSVTTDLHHMLPPSYTIHHTLECYVYNTLF